MRRKFVKPSGPQTLNPLLSRASVKPGRTFTHLRVWRATHKKLLDIAGVKNDTLAFTVSRLVEKEWERVFGE